SRRILIVTGAGISVSSGIPDFRSEDGLFETLRRQYPRFLSSGSDLFDARLFSNPVTTQLFYRFMGQFRRQVVNAEVTPTHKFMKELELKNKLLRVYSQNIDGLERKTPATIKNTLVVLLHGELNNVICTLCREETEFTAELADRFSRASPSNLESLQCSNCANIQRARFAIGKRTLGTGFLRPNIVLYNEEHPDCDRIGILSEFDLRRKPDLLLVMGTSLRIPGVIRLVKEAARTVQSNGNGRGKVIYVNKTAPTTSRWRDLFDYHLEGDADIIVTM
ncbi:DHS-like NAD/FAD-binding domain-containing protein, partial [Ramicandelaber brevisporus]